MAGYIARRVFYGFVVILAVLVLNFVLMNLAPGNPIQMIGLETGISNPEYVQYMIKRWGLDQPLYVRLGLYIWNVLHGDLGISYRYAEPVTSLIFERLPATLMITVPSILLAFVLGTLLASLSLWEPGGALDAALTTMSMAFYSAPAFWLGIVLMNVFSVNLKVLPSTGMVSSDLVGQEGSLAYYLDVAKHAILPITTLTLGMYPAYFRLVKGVMGDQLAEDYVLALRAKGIPKFAILYRHVLRNALLPAITLLGIQMGFAFAGAAVVENVFAWPGIGRLLLDAVSARDYPLIEGIFVFVTTMVVVANIVTDIAYGFVDPRIRRR